MQPDPQIVWENAAKVVRRHGHVDYLSKWKYRLSNGSRVRSISEVDRRLKAYHAHTHLQPPMEKKAAFTDAETLRRLPDFAYDSKTQIGTIRFYIFVCFEGKPKCKKDEDELIVAVRTTLNSWQKKGLKGLLLDFRKHYGGSFWPLLSSFSSILYGLPLFAWVQGTSPPSSRAKRWMVVGPDGKSLDDIAHDTSTPVSLNVPYRIALILGPKTYSSGEIAAAMFAGKENVKSFGSTTGGGLSVNEGFDVGGGYLCILTSHMVALSDGRMEESLIPDRATPRPIEMARRWLTATAYSAPREQLGGNI